MYIVDKEQNAVGMLKDDKVMLFLCDNKVEDMTVKEVITKVDEDVGMYVLED